MSRRLSLGQYRTLYRRELARNEKLQQELEARTMRVAYHYSAELKRLRGRIVELLRIIEESSNVI